MSSAIALQLGSSAGLVFAVAVCGVAVFLLVLLLRIMPLIHKPKVTRRVGVKPIPFRSTTDTMQSTGGTPSLTGMDVLPPIGRPIADRVELLQAKSQWERLVQEAESNEQLTPEQRESFVEEARKNIAEINKQLGEASQLRT